MKTYTIATFYEGYFGQPFHKYIYHLDTSNNRWNNTNNVYEDV